MAAFYESIEQFLKDNKNAVLKVGHAEGCGFLATFVVKKTNEKVGPNGRFADTVDDALITLNRRLNGEED